MKTNHIIAILCLLLLPLGASAADYDLSIPPQGLQLTATEDILIGDVIKIYATINNIGASDIEGTAICKDNGNLIGMKSLSAKYSGATEEVWFTWVPMQAGEHTITLDVMPDGEITDANPADNHTSVTVSVDSDNDNDGIGDATDPDDDNDGVPDDEDDYPNDPERSHDTDGDGQDDSEDSDDDNDGLYDWEETGGSGGGGTGSNPKKYDTDGDGVGDKEDVFPTDPNRTTEPAPAPEQEPEPEPEARVLGSEDQTETATKVEPPQPRVLDSEDTQSTTSAIVHEDPIATLQADDNYNKKDGLQVEVKNKPNWLSWPYILWLFAAAFALLAGIFFIIFVLSRKDSSNKK